LGHDSFVIQISKLHGEMKTKMERILSIFNQKWIFDEDNKWLLQYDEENDEENKNIDEETRKILNRLSIAAESNEVKAQIKAEETFDDSMDSALRMKEIVIEQKEAVLEQKDIELKEKDLKLSVQQKELEELRKILSKKD